MLHEESHLSDQDLVLAADGELSSKRSAEIREHLAACWSCRARMSQLERAITDFVEARRGLDGELPPVAGPRALLRARLAEARAQETPGFAAVVFGLLRWPVTRILAAVAASLLLLAALGLAMRTSWPGLRLFSIGGEAAAAPKARLTPGATVPLTREDVCNGNPSTQAQVLPASLERRVLEEYGVTTSRPDAYEIDYLITPELGGATNIRNLWPQPYNTAWNARVKDQLEERLHTMVCNGEIDLATAQHEIAVDWIAAYKKYFHTNRPLVDKRQTGHWNSPRLELRAEIWARGRRSPS